MTTPALPTTHHPVLRPVEPSAGRNARRPPERAGLLALAAPLLLFADGILRWVATVTTLGDPGSAPPHTTLDYAAGSIGVATTVVLVASIAAFGWLAVEVLRHPRLSHRLSVGHLLVAAGGVAAIAVPLDLLPLGALLLLIGLAPLSHDAMS